MNLRIAFDIGGTLAKVICFAPKIVLDTLCIKFSTAVLIHEQFKLEEHEISLSDLAIVSDPEGLSDLEFAMLCFSSRDITPLLNFLSDFMSYTDGVSALVIPVTGGGAVKFRSELEKTAPNATIVKVDEMKAIAEGFSFLVRNAGSAFIFDSKTQSCSPVPIAEIQDPFPLLLVNVGSGVSMIKIDGPGEFIRVQGSPIGGGTVLGLGKILFNAESFEEIMDLSMKGDSNKVDLSVGDLLGRVFSQDEDDESEQIWNFNTVASSLAKLKTGNLDIAQHRADLAQSVVRMVSYNIGYIAYLVARLYSINRIYFSGKYVNKHIPTMDAISYAVRFYEKWRPPPVAEGSIDPADLESNRRPSLSANSTKSNSHQIPPTPKLKFNVRFLHQEGYVGAIGALLTVYKRSTS